MCRRIVCKKQELMELEYEARRLLNRKIPEARVKAELEFKALEEAKEKLRGAFGGYTVPPTMTQLSPLGCSRSHCSRFRSSQHGTVSR